MATKETYENIDRPYNQFLERDSQPGGAIPTAVQNAQSIANSGVNVPASGGGSAASSGDNGGVEQVAVKNDGDMVDVWIKNFIRSENWKPKKVGFNINGQNGHAEFCDVYISGEIEALSGLIGGFTIGDTDLSATYLGNKTILSSGTVSFASGVDGDPNIQITQAGRILVGADDPIVIDGVDKEIESSNYVSGAFGTGFHLDSDLLEVGNIACRGLFRTSVFQKDIINVIAGSFVVAPNGDVLDVDMTADNNSTLTIKGTVTLAVNDILRMKEVNGTDSNDEWMRVVDISQAPTYVVARDLSSNYDTDNNPAWKKGSAVVDYGQSGQGGIYMTASDSTAPYLSVYDHEGSPWSDINTRLRLGNLNGFLGYSDDLYGIAIGETNKYLKYDLINGLQIKGNITATTGAIGGWVINADSLTDAAGVVGMSSAVTAGDDIRFWAGDSTPGSAEFRVTEAGVLTASSATITGAINATSGKIGTATNYWDIGSTGITAVSASTDVVIKYGKTDFGQDATAGFILGYDYSATKSKFEIGSSATKIFKYDGIDFSLIGGTITGATIQTATTGYRVKLTSSNGIGFFNGTTQTGYIQSDTDASMVFQTADNFYFIEDASTYRGQLDSNGWTLPANTSFQFQSGRSLTDYGSGISTDGEFKTRKVYPSSDNTYELGDSDKRWSKGHFEDLDCDDLYVGVSADLPGLNERNLLSDSQLSLYKNLAKAEVSDKEIQDKIKNTKDKTLQEFEAQDLLKKEKKLLQKQTNITGFEMGDVLVWGNGKLELCSIEEDKNVMAVGSYRGMPCVLGAEQIKVSGKVKQGDFLVSSDIRGYAIAKSNPKIGTVIAQSLEEKNTEENGIIKAMIRKF